tara:strand:- start:784 stop:1182 length:399 start_codon:yes stop_codon:yes gene_type:complete
MMIRKKKGHKNARSKKILGKSDAQRFHANKRGGQRYGGMSDDVQREIVRRIVGRKGAIQLGKQSARVKLYDVRYGLTIYRVVFDLKRKTLVTFLPPGEIPFDDRTKFNPHWESEYNAKFPDKTPPHPQPRCD